MTVFSSCWVLRNALKTVPIVDSANMVGEVREDVAARLDCQRTFRGMQYTIVVLPH